MNGEVDRGLERKVFIGFLLTLGLILLTGAYFLTESRRQAAAERGFLERSQRWGAELFLLNCVQCHGERGEGLVGPPLRDTKLDEKSIVLTTSRGRPWTAMPAFAKEEGGALTGYQVHDLARFIRHWSDEALEEARRRHQAQVGGATPSPTPPPASPVELGKALFKEKGCGLCHTVAGISSSPVGPELSTIGSVAETRQAGVSAADYLRQSLLNPGAFLVPGFPPAMPSFQDKLSAPELEALVAFLLSLK